MRETESPLFPSGGVGADKQTAFRARGSGARGPHAATAKAGDNSSASVFRTWLGRCHLKSSPMNYRTKAEYFIQGITQGFVEASEVIAWSDEVIVTAPKPEDWMIEISSCGPDDRMVVLSHLNTIKGDVDAAELAALLKARGVV
jgi:hypothetical protein